MLTKDQGICIRAVDYSETSQIVTFFTRDSGRLSAIAKGSKRPRSAFDGPIEVFSYGRLVFSGSSRSNLATLTEFESARGGPGFTRLAKDLFTLNCCQFAAELLNKLTDDYDPHPQLFDSFLQFLQNTNQNRASRNEHRDMLVLLILFQLALLKEVGLQPILNACANCKTRYEMRDTTREVYFSSSANGLICRDCEASFPDKLELSTSAAGCLNNLKLMAEANEKTVHEIESVLVDYFTHILNRPPKMAKYVLKN
jgi:DNA repair protein RecO (recombination protein O)